MTKEMNSILLEHEYLMHQTNVLHHAELHSNKLLDGNPF